MSKPSTTAREKVEPTARKKATEQKKSLPVTMRLQALRQARNLSQEQLAKNLSVKQAAVSKLEKRADMHISTLRNLVKAMGGDLEIIATFSDWSVRISPFEEIAEKTKGG
ncbi:MAG: helix-turn-helix domain-containing protein [Syntrophales bacterium]